MTEFEELENVNKNLVYIGDTPEQYKKAILGVTVDGKNLIYSYDRLVELMMEENGWSYEDAVDWVESNTVRGCEYMGENKPIIVDDIIQEES